MGLGEVTMPAWLDTLFSVLSELAIGFCLGYEVAMRRSRRELAETESRWFGLVVDAIDGRLRKGGGS